MAFPFRAGKFVPSQSGIESRWNYPESLLLVLSKCYHETMPGVSCPHQKLYRTVQQLRAEAPHPGVDSLFDRSQSNRKYNYNYIFTQICGGGKCLSHFVHSFIPPHSLVYNTCKYFSTKLFIHFIISSYGVLCRHSYTPLLTQTHEIESRKYISCRMYTNV